LSVSHRLTSTAILRREKIRKSGMKELNILLAKVKQIGNPTTRKLAAECVAQLALILNALDLEDIESMKCRNCKKEVTEVDV